LPPAVCAITILSICSCSIEHLQCGSSWRSLPWARRFRQLIESERRRWAPFERALPKEEQVAFDRLFDCAKLQVQASVMVSRPWAFETMVMAVLLEQEKRIERLLKLLEERCAGACAIRR
jgi:hypothetical protein